MRQTWRAFVLRVPGGSRPFLRLALLVVVIVAGDLITEQSIDRGWRMPLTVVSALRVLSVLPVLRYPLAGFVFALEVDKWDWSWLGAGHRDEEFQSLYQKWDKTLDLALLTTAAMVAFRWRDRRARVIALSTFGWRSAGTVLFVATGESRLLVAFPNAFENWFLLYVVYFVLTGRDQMLLGARSTVVIFLAALLPKVAVEVFLHALDTRPWDLVSLPTPAALEPWIWGTAMYALPVIALAYLILVTRDGPARAGDREVRLGPV